MSRRILTGRLNQQPQHAARIDTSSDLGRMLAASVTASQSHSAVLEKPITLGAGVPRVPTQHGIAFQHSAANGGVGFGAPGGMGTVVAPGTPLSVFLRVFVSTLDVRQGLMTDHDAAGANDSFSLEITAANKWNFTGATAGNLFAITSASNVTLGWHDVLVVHRPGTGNQLYVDGLSVGTTAFTDNLRNGSVLRLGNFGAYPSIGFQGRTAVCHIFKGDVSAQLRQLSNNPWQVHSAPPRVLWPVASAVAPTTVDITSAWTEQAETSSIVASVRANAAASWVEGAEVASITAAASVNGAAAWVESGELTAINASASASAAAAWSEGAETTSASAVAQVNGSAAWVEAPESSTLAALVGDSVAAAAAWAEADEVFSLTTSAQIIATSAWSESSEAHAVAASVGNDVAITAAWTEASEATSLSAAAQVNASAGWVEGSEVIATTAMVGDAVSVSAGWTEASETFAALATVRVDAAAGWAEQADTTGFNAQVLAAAGLGWVESPETMAATATVAVEPRAAINWTEAPDGFALVITSQALAHIPASHRYTVAPDDRTFTIAPEDRTYTIGADSRTYTI